MTAEAICGLLTETQRAELGLDHMKPVEKGTGIVEPECSYQHTTSVPRFGITVGRNTKEDASTGLVGEGEYAGRVVMAAGFPAVERHLDAGAGACFVNVSVVKGQSLAIQYLAIGKEKLSRADLCAKGLRVAEMAMQNLLSQR